MEKATSTKEAAEMLKTATSTTDELGPTMMVQAARVSCLVHLQHLVREQ